MSTTANRARLLREILEINPSCSTGYLEKFSDEELLDYRDHLMHAQVPREEGKAWGRKVCEPAITSRESDI